EEGPVETFWPSCTTILERWWGDRRDRASAFDRPRGRTGDLLKGGGQAPSLSALRHGPDARADRASEPKSRSGPGRGPRSRDSTAPVRRTTRASRRRPVPASGGEVLG